MSTAQRIFGWGASAGHLADLEAAYGGPVDYVRIYGWVGQIPKGVEALASTRRVIVSMKFRDASGATIPAADIAAGRHAADVAAFVAWFNALPKCPAGPHILTPEHEIDAKAAAASGNTAALNAAFDYCTKTARASAGWSGLVACCVTGFDPSHREILYAVDFAESDVICIDQPYAQGVPPFASADSIAGPTVDYFTKTYPGKPIIITEWGATPSSAAHPTARADWMVAFGKALTGPRYAQVVGATYWDDIVGSFDCVLATPADRAAWAAAGAVVKASSAPPVPVPPVPVPVPPTPPPPVTTKPVDLTALAGLSDAMAAFAVSLAALNTAQAAFVAAQADYAAKSAAAVKAAAVVTG